MHREPLDLLSYRAHLNAVARSKALGGNVAMLIWLGKQYLGQRDTPLPVTPVDARGQPLVPQPIASALSSYRITGATSSRARSISRT